MATKKIPIKRKWGCPKKVTKNETLIDFRPAPLADEDWEKIEACAQANWQVHWKENDAALSIEKNSWDAAVVPENQKNAQEVRQEEGGIAKASSKGKVSGKEVLEVFEGNGSIRNSSRRGGK